MGIFHNFLFIEQITNRFMIVEIIIICRKTFIHYSLNCPVSVFFSSSWGGFHYASLWESTITYSLRPGQSQVKFFSFFSQLTTLANVISFSYWWIAADFVPTRKSNATWFKFRPRCVLLTSAFWGKTPIMFDQEVGNWAGSENRVKQSHESGTQIITFGKAMLSDLSHITV